MTATTTLLRETYGAPRRLVCAIDGLQQLIWQDDGTGVAPTRAARSAVADVTDLVALEPPDGELSFGIDIAEMSLKPSSMTIAFRNVDDPSATSTKYFAKLFAAGRHASPSQKSVHLKRTSDTSQYVLSTATTLKCKEDNSGWSASGYAYTARETIYYSGLGGSSPTWTFTGCTRGCFSCTDLSGATSWAPTYKVPDYSNSNVGALGIEISTVPFSWIGRRIALWVVGYDDSIAAWRTNVSGAIDGSLLWIGRIQSIRYNGARGTWELGCDHILADLEEDIAGGMPTARLDGLNMWGPQGLTFHCYPNGLIADNLVVSVTPGVYETHAALAKEINTKLGPIHATLSFDGQYYSIWWYNYTGSTDRLWVIPWPDYSNPAIDAQTWCHALEALGFDDPGGHSGYLSGPVSSQGSIKVIEAKNPPFVSYHPLDYSCNGLKLHYKRSGDAGLWDGTYQGGYGADIATVEIDQLGKQAVNVEAKAAYLRYNGTSSDSYAGSTGTTGTLALIDVDPDEPWAAVCNQGWYRTRAFAGQTIDGDECVVRNVQMAPFYDANMVARYPFKLLLHHLLSTGTLTANHATYDSLPLELGAAMQASLVDVQSFLDADEAVKANALAVRRQYLIGEPVSWSELLQRECKLFGYVLAWDSMQAKLSLRSVYAHGFDTYTEVLSDSSGTAPDEYPDADHSVDTVINRWELSIVYDRVRKKYEKAIVVEDEDSIQSLHTAKTVSVKHPGVYLSGGTISAVDQIVRDLFIENRYCWRYPWGVVTKTLAPTLMRRLSIGDMVMFSSSRMPDPYGGGTMSTSCFALVTNLTWDLSRWTGKATLLLYSGFDAAYVTPWAWSALATAWNAGAVELTVERSYWGQGADSDDAAELADGDFVDIVERAPADPTAPQSWRNIEVESYASGVITCVAGTTLTGWSSSKEYVVLPSLYGGSATTTQKIENAYQADATAPLLGGTDPPHRYG